MGKIISISNQKGGVGKTTTAINLSALLADKGKKILLVDIDPQGNAGSGLGINTHTAEKTIYGVLTEEYELKDAIIKTEFKNLDLLPANIHLSGVQVELNEKSDYYKLKSILEPVKDNYDAVFIDCPPSLGTLTLLALIASDGVFITLQCEYYALEGLTQLLKLINLIQDNYNKDLEIEGLILTMYDGRTNLSTQVAEDVRSHFKEKVFRTIIPRNVKLSEAPSFGKPIHLYDKDCVGAVSYEKLSKEVLTLVK